MTFDNQVLAGRSSTTSAFSPSPARVLVAGFVLVCAVLAVLPLNLPIGVGYWDLSMYLDSGYRIALGQMPHRDFFVPFGPLSTYLFWLFDTLFPNMHPVLAAQLPFGLLCLPFLLVVLRDVRSRTVGYLLVFSFLAMTLLPINIFQRFVQSSVDGFGIYNRQAGFALFLMVAAVWQARSRSVLLIVLTAALVMLALTKITAFAVALPLAALVVVQGRLSLRDACAVAVAAAVLVVAIELPSGLISSYLSDIREMVASNDGGTLRRLYATTSEQLATLLLLGALVFFAARGSARRITVGLRALPARPLRAIRVLSRVPALSFALLTLLAVLIESQNSGSQEFAFLLPAIFALMLPFGRWKTAPVPVVALVFCALMATEVAERVVRTGITLVSGQRIEVGETDPFRVVTKPQFIQQSGLWRAMTGREGDVFARASSLGYTLTQPSFYDRIDFQVFFLQSAGEAARALKTVTLPNGSPVRTAASLDFVDPVAYLAGLEPVKGLAVVMDPYRTVSPNLHARMLKAWADTDAILVPYCPSERMRIDIAALARPELDRRTRIELNPCWDAFVKS